MQMIKPVLNQQKAADIIERSVVIHGLEALKLNDDDNHDPCEVIQDWCKEVLGVNCVILKIDLIPSCNKKGHDMVKCELSSVDQKIEVLHAKGKCKSNTTYKRVYITKCKTREELTAEHNA